MFVFVQRASTESPEAFVRLCEHDGFIPIDIDPIIQSIQGLYDGFDSPKELEETLHGLQMFHRGLAEGEELGPYGLFAGLIHIGMEIQKKYGM